MARRPPATSAREQCGAATAPSAAPVGRPTPRRGSIARTGWRTLVALTSTSSALQRRGRRAGRRRPAMRRRASSVAASKAGRGTGGRANSVDTPHMLTTAHAQPGTAAVVGPTPGVRVRHRGLAGATSTATASASAAPFTTCPASAPVTQILGAAPEAAVLVPAGRSLTRPSSPPRSTRSAEPPPAGDGRGSRAAPPDRRGE